MDLKEIKTLVEQQSKRIPQIQVPAVPAAIVAMETLQAMHLCSQLLLKLLEQKHSGNNSDNPLVQNWSQ